MISLSVSRKYKIKSQHHIWLILASHGDTWMALASVLGIKVANEELAKKKMLVCAQLWYRLQAWTCGEWWMKKKYLPCISAYFAVAAEALRFFLFYEYFFLFSVQDGAQMQKCTFWRTDVMASRQMKAQPCTHTDTHTYTEADTRWHTHNSPTHTHKSLFSFLRDRALLQAWPLYHNNPVHLSSLCLLLSLFVSLLARRPPSHSVITLTPPLSCFASFFLCVLVFFPYVSP